MSTEMQTHGHSKAHPRNILLLIPPVISESILQSSSTISSKCVTDWIQELCGRMEAVSLSSLSRLFSLLYFYARWPAFDKISAGKLCKHKICTKLGADAQLWGEMHKKSQNWDSCPPHHLGGINIVRLWPPLRSARFRTRTSKDRAINFLLLFLITKYNFWNLVSFKITWAPFKIAKRSSNMIFLTL